MASSKVIDKAGLGRLVLCAATDQALKTNLIQNPAAMLNDFIEDIPEGHVIK